MKKFSLLALVIVLASCKKEVSPNGKMWELAANLTYTILTDSLRENTDGAGWVTYHFTDPAISAKWSFDFWWADGIGYTFPAPENVGHGVRLSPIDPRIPNGERVKQEFTWFMEGEGSLVANIGGNRAEILINGNSVIIHQLAGPGPNEIERWYFCHKAPNGANMDGQGGKRAYGYFKRSLQQLKAA